jgi:hypothetical protein
MKLLRTALSALVLASLLSFGACSTDPKTTSSQTPAQTVYEAKSGYAVTLTAAVAYKRLPSCDTAPQPCSSKAVVAQLQRADDVASAALNAAETAARTPGLGDSAVNASAIAAKAALDAFSSITASLTQGK